MFTLNIVERLILERIFLLIMVEELRRMKGYRQVSLPDALYREIEEALRKGHSYTSVADFVKYVVRKELERSVSP